MEHDDIINEMYDIGFEHSLDYLTRDICFDYEGCRGEPLIFRSWSAVEAFVRVVKGYAGVNEDED